MRLQEAYSARRVADVLNRGYSGYNTRCELRDGCRGGAAMAMALTPAGLLARWALLQLPHLIAQTQSAPAVCTVFFGANDAAVSASTQSVPLEEYKTNLEAMVKLLRDAWPACPIIIIAPPPVHEEKWDEGRGGPGGGMRELERTRLYAQAACEVAGRLKCESVDLFGRLIAREDWRDCLSDGLHLAANGNHELYDAVTAAIGSAAPHLDPELAPPHFPFWSDVAEAADGPQSLIPPLELKPKPT